MGSNLATISAYLTGKGLSPAQTAGVLGNLAVESGFDPTNVNTGEGAIGIAQWEGPRRVALQAYARSSGGSESDLATQLGFMWQELTGSESGSLARLRATTTPAAAATVWDQYYERSDGSARSQRISLANSYAGGGGIAVAGAGLDLGGAGAAVSGALGGAAGGALGALGAGVVNPVVSAVTPVIYRGLAVLIAGSLITLGVYKMFGPTVKTGASTAAGAAGSVAKIAAL